MNKHKLFYIKEDLLSDLNDEREYLLQMHEQGKLDDKLFSWKMFKNAYELKCIKGFEIGKNNYKKVTSEERKYKLKIIAEIYQELGSYYDTCYLCGKDVVGDIKVQNKQLLILCIENS